MNPSLIYSSMWSRYLSALQAAPLRTKAATSASICAVSDLGLQLYENGQQKAIVTRLQATYGENAPVNLQRGCAVNVGYQIPEGSAAKAQIALDLKRTSILATVGLLYSGPINHAWYAVLEKLVRVRGAAAAAVTKTTIDQLVFTPFAIGGYFCVRGLLEGNSIDPEIITKLKRKLVDATLAAYQFWPFAQLVAFSLVPVDLRVLFGSVCAVFWNARLSMINSSRLDEVAERRFETPDEFAPPREPLAEACKAAGVPPMSTGRWLSAVWLAPDDLEALFASGGAGEAFQVVKTVAMCRAESVVCTCPRCRALRA